MLDLPARRKDRKITGTIPVASRKTIPFIQDVAPRQHHQCFWRFARNAWSAFRRPIHEKYKTTSTRPVASHKKCCHTRCGSVPTPSVFHSFPLFSIGQWNRMFDLPVGRKEQE
jgi:hypothetical protein